MTQKTGGNKLLAIKTFPNLAYGEEPWMLFDLYLPGTAPRGTVIRFHGGGLEGGSRQSILFANDLTDASFAAASVSYRLFVRILKVLHPEADVTHVELPGPHSSGSTGRGPDGAFAFVSVFLNWVNIRTPQAAFGR